MCSILGIHINNTSEDTMKDIYSLMEQSKIRGLHSFGTCFYNGNQFIVEKSNILSKSLLEKYVTNFAFTGGKTPNLIFHSRYSTSGDYKNMNNNQPIIVSNLAIAMNGVIHMGTKEEFEKEFEVECSTDNDTEILLRKIIESKDTVFSINDFLELNPKISIAAVLLKDNTLYAFRNNKRPLYHVCTKDLQVFCSTLDIVNRSSIKNKLTSKPYIVKPFEVHQIE